MFEKYLKVEKYIQDKIIPKLKLLSNYLSKGISKIKEGFYSIPKYDKLVFIILILIHLYLFYKAVRYQVFLSLFLSFIVIILVILANHRTKAEKKSNLVIYSLGITQTVFWLVVLYQTLISENFVKELFILVLLSLGFLVFYSYKLKWKMRTLLPLPLFVFILYVSITPLIYSSYERQDYSWAFTYMEENSTKFNGASLSVHYFAPSRQEIESYIYMNNIKPNNKYIVKFYTNKNWTNSRLRVEYQNQTMIKEEYNTTQMNITIPNRESVITLFYATSKELIPNGRISFSFNAYNEKQYYNTHFINLKVFYNPLFYECNNPCLSSEEDGLTRQITSSYKFGSTINVTRLEQAIYKKIENIQSKSNDAHTLEFYLVDKRAKFLQNALFAVFIGVVMLVLNELWRYLGKKI